MVRHNAWAELRNVPGWLLELFVRHLSVPVPLGTEKGSRFGVLWSYQGERWGSLVHGTRIPTGLVPHVCALAEHYGVPARVEEARARPVDAVPWWGLGGPWRPYQEQVHQELLKASRGVVDAPPRSGKTRMGARIVDSLGLPAVWIVPSVQIVQQTYNVLVDFWGPEHVGRFDGQATPEQRIAEREVVVATPQSALSLPKDWWATRLVLLIDEFHHSASEMYHRISNLAVNAYYRYGLTGTHFRTGDDLLAMEAVCSRKLAKIEIGDLVRDGYLAEPRVMFVRAPGIARSGGFEYREAYRRGIVHSKGRNALIAKLAHMLLERGEPTLVLTRQRAHADKLGRMIEGAQVVKGGAGASTARTLQAFSDGRYECLVGTTVIGEGIDLPRASALVYACAGCDGVSQVQSYFRPLTAAPGKRYGRIYDFWDGHHKTLERHSNRRLAMSRQQFGARVTEHDL